MIFLRKPRFLAVQPSSWPTTVSLLQRLQSQGWIFRGQHQATWSLETTLERLHQKNNVPDSHTKTPDLRLYERERIITYIKQYRSPLIAEKPRSMWEAVMTMQHYGWPTRLLDFTKCFKRAIFFALPNEPKAPWAIWCINRHHLKKRSMQRVRALLARSKVPVATSKLADQCHILDRIDNELSESDDYYRLLVENLITVGITEISIYDQIEESISFIVQPFSKLIDNERIYRQRGLFLAPFNLGHHPRNIYHDSTGKPLITRFEKNLFDSLDFNDEDFAEYVKVNQNCLYRHCEDNLPIEKYAIIKFVLSPDCYVEANALLVAEPLDLIDAIHLGL